LKTYDLAATSRATCQDLVWPPNGIRLLVRHLASDQVVDRELNGLLWRHANHLRQHARVQTLDALVLDDLACAVERVVVQPLTHAAAPLVLHARLDQIDRVDHEGAKGTSDTAESEVVGSLGNVVQPASRLCKGLGSDLTGLPTQLRHVRP
jgi:hypothetical protein